MINRFIFGQGVVIYFIMQLLLKKSSKTPTSFTSKRENQDNMSVKCIPPYIPLLYSRPGVYKGIHFFLNFA